MPPHPQQTVGWVQNIPLVSAGHKGSTTSFNYIAPVIKWSEAAKANTSPTYRGGEAYAIGNQPYDSRELWIAKRTPATPRLLNNQQGYRGVQSTTSILQSQMILGQMLAQRGK
jgi:hypothetical protein